MTDSILKALARGEVPVALVEEELERKNVLSEDRCEPTNKQVDSACLSYRHDFGLLTEDERKQVRFEAREWLRAWLKEGIGCDRNEVIERCAAVVDQCNREGPYQAIAAAPRIRALKAVNQEERGE